jgi:putative membrane protein
MSHRKLGFHYFIRSGILAFFAYYILRLVKQEQLIIYIGPRMQVYVKLAAIGFYVLAVLQIYLAFRTWWGDRVQAADCGCGSCSPAASSRAGRTFFYSLFAVPVLLFLLLPDQALSSSLVQKKGISLTGTISGKSASTGTPDSAQGNSAVTETSGSNTTPGQPGTPAPQSPAAAASASPEPSAPTIEQTASGASLTSGNLDVLFPHDEYSEDLAKLAKKLYKKDTISIEEKGFMEVVSSIDFYMDNFTGKQVDISGFVYREDDMPENQFVVARFAVQCCSADAAPFGFMVEGSLGKELKKDAWVKITGTLGTTLYNGNNILKINASKIERIPEPKTPYVFPDFEYFNTTAYD